MMNALKKKSPSLCKDTDNTSKPMGKTLKTPLCPYPGTAGWNSGAGAAYAEAGRGRLRLANAGAGGGPGRIGCGGMTAGGAGGFGAAAAAARRASLATTRAARPCFFRALACRWARAAGVGLAERPGTRRGVTGTPGTAAVPNI
jgi:hypothetical protein